MSLTDPKIHYITIRDAIVTFLRAQTTALNVGLTAGTFATSTEQIFAGDPVRKSIPDSSFPAIMVKMKQKDEAFEFLGNAGRKRPKIKFYLYACIMDMSGNTDTEIATLVDNIEALFRDNIKIDNNVLFSDLGIADFGIQQLESGTWVDIAVIEIACTVDLK